MNGTLERIELLVEKEGIERLRKATVMVVGVGGVGSFAAESLARGGVGTIILVDGDVVAISNLNRQIHATYNTIGKSKVEVMKERILTYNAECHVICKKIFYDGSKNDELFDQEINYVIDAIDMITSKVDLIQACLRKKIKFISCLGMANKWDPTQIEVSELMKTSYDPLAKVMRSIVRERRINGKIPVLYSKEQNGKQHKIIDEAGVTRKQKMPPASTPFVPCAAGITCASIAVKHILQMK